MFDTAQTDAEIASYEVSEDGVHWRPYDAARDTDPLLHKRIEFAPVEAAAPSRAASRARA